MKHFAAITTLVLSALALVSCEGKSPPNRPEHKSASNYAKVHEGDGRRYFLASLVKFEGALPCPFMVNAITPFCMNLAAPPFAKGRGRVIVVRTADRCEANIAGIRCDGSHLLFDSTTLDTIFGMKHFAAGGAFLIDQIASGKGDWIYRLYDGDGYNMEATCYYPARDNGISAAIGQLSDQEVGSLCRLT